MTGDLDKKGIDENEITWLYNDLYPERRGLSPKRNWLRMLFGLEGPLVKLLLSALNASGCEFDFRRHISCEICDAKVSGGYDQELNQVIVCQNIARRKSYVQAALTHEMIHMFDYCRNEFNFRNIRHLACSEIRAANLAHCSFFSALRFGTASLTRFKATHQNCVKAKALTSILAVKEISENQALAAIDEVFPKCYADLEPIGRRCRRNSNNMEMALLEAPLYGYDYYI
ncbi:mitochondrial inner membrane protease ATP23 homolog isoform X2 [Phymastichus coffea]|uniref:mitochondrial inner membrane protease ATP23 homolog isoform X2 n=2 Tax=Phymastichus coffea TaxID=108790 RepID=UPI00273C247C|nr:mitochondrial inner membrane protease ATP23 homolog isoform X2 [Phymastichus coffea]